MLDAKKEFIITAADRQEGSNNNESSRLVVSNKEIFALSKEDRACLNSEEKQWIEIIVEEYLKEKNLKQKRKYENKN